LDLFGDDSPNPNHDSRVRENSEVVIKFTQLYEGFRFVMGVPPNILTQIFITPSHILPLIHLDFYKCYVPPLSAAKLPAKPAPQELEQEFPAKLRRAVAEKKAAVTKSMGRSSKFIGIYRDL